MGMMSLVTVSWVQPPGRSRGIVVEGRDEDPFTLLVEAGERLFGALRPPEAQPRPLPRLLLLAGDPPGQDARELFQAWGIPPVPVEVHPPGELGAYQAIARAVDAKEPLAEVFAVLVAQRARPHPEGGGSAPLKSAGAVGLLFGSGPGLHLVSKTGAQSTPGGPEARRRALELAVRRGGPEWEGPWGALTVSGEEGLAALEDLREVVSGGGALPPLEASPAGEEGGDSALGPARALALLAHVAPAGARGLWVHARGHFVALRSFQGEGGLSLQGFPPGDGATWEVADEGRGDHPALDPVLGVSQGAYLPAARYRETIPTRWRLEGDRCGACGQWTLPPRGSCSACGRMDQLARGNLPRIGGLLEATTVIRPGAQPAELDTLGVGHPGGYAVGLVRFAPGGCLPLQLTDLEPPVPCPGRRVETVLRRIYYQEGSWRYGLKARLLPGVPEPLERPKPREVAAEATARGPRSRAPSQRVRSGKGRQPATARARPGPREKVRSRQGR
jgi:uncharacterized OB-fold protein